MCKSKIVHGFLVKVGPSIFTNRTGRTDIRIMRESEWGSREDNGRRYSTCQVLATESLETIRNYYDGNLQGKVLDAAVEFSRSVLTCNHEPIQGAL